MRRFSFQPALTFRGRKFKGVRGLAGKPFHPPLTDITVGAYTIGPILDLVAFAFRDSAWSGDLLKAGGWVLLAGAISSVATSLTGFADWLNTKPATQVRRMVNAHAWTMITLSVVVLIDLWYRNFAEGGEYYTEPDGLLAVLALAILGLVTMGGTVGGSLTYDWGFNVEISKDHPAYHPGERDFIHPHDEAPK